jgi:hypothetical protein
MWGGLLTIFAGRKLPPLFPHAAKMQPYTQIYGPTIVFASNLSDCGTLQSTSSSFYTHSTRLTVKLRQKRKRPKMHSRDATNTASQRRLCTNKYLARIPAPSMPMCRVCEVPAAERCSTFTSLKDSSRSGLRIRIDSITALLYGSLTQLKLAAQEPEGKVRSFVQEQDSAKMGSNFSKKGPRRSPYRPYTYATIIIQRPLHH